MAPPFMSIIKPIIIVATSSLIFLFPTKDVPAYHPASVNQATSHAKLAEKHVEPVFKAEATLAAVYVAPKVEAAPASPAEPARTSGSCDSWKAQAGIPNTYATNKLINNESGCKWWAVNPKSGACGIPQSWPCSKLGCPLTEAGAVCQLQWMKKYVADVYGTWEHALAKWESRCSTPQGCWY